MKLPSDKCHLTLLMISEHWSGIGLVPSSNKPLSEPMLMQIYAAIWRQKATMGQISELFKYLCRMKAYLSLHGQDILW